MSFRYAEFIIERKSPSQVYLRQVMSEGTKANGRPYYRTIERFSNSASAIEGLMGRLAQDGKDIREVEAHWSAFAKHLERTHELVKELQAMGVT